MDYRIRSTSPDRLRKTHGVSMVRMAKCIIVLSLLFTCIVNNAIAQNQSHTLHKFELTEDDWHQYLAAALATLPKEERALVKILLGQEKTIDGTYLDELRSISRDLNEDNSSFYVFPGYGNTYGIYTPFGIFLAKQTRYRMAGRTSDQFYIAGKVPQHWHEQYSDEWRLREYIITKEYVNYEQVLNVAVETVPFLGSADLLINRQQYWEGSIGLLADMTLFVPWLKATTTGARLVRIALVTSGCTAGILSIGRLGYLISQGKATWMDYAQTALVFLDLAGGLRGVNDDIAKIIPEGRYTKYSSPPASCRPKVVRPCQCEPIKYKGPDGTYSTAQVEEMIDYSDLNPTVNSNPRKPPHPNKHLPYKVEKWTVEGGDDAFSPEEFEAIFGEPNALAPLQKYSKQIVEGNPEKIVGTNLVTVVRHRRQGVNRVRDVLNENKEALEALKVGERKTFGKTFDTTIEVVQSESSGNLFSKHMKYMEVTVKRDCAAKSGFAILHIQPK